MAETGAVAPSLPAVLLIAARAFLDEAERRRGAPESWVNARFDVLRSFVLLAAMIRYDEPYEPFRVLGLESLIRHRNHHKVLRRELARAAELYATLEVTPEPDVAEVLRQRR